MRVKMTVMNLTLIDQNIFIFSVLSSLEKALCEIEELEGKIKSVSFSATFSGSKFTEFHICVFISTAIRVVLVEVSPQGVGVLKCRTLWDRRHTLVDL